MGLVIVILFLGGVVAFYCWFVRRFGPGIARKQRDRQIEIATRLALADAETQEEIIRRIQAERNQR